MGMNPEEVLAKEKLNQEEMIRKDEREKVLNEIISFCEERKTHLMNLSIPLREKALKAFNSVIQHCCEIEGVDSDDDEA